MARTRIIFVELAVPNKMKYVCDIVEKLYGSAKSIHVFAADSAAGRLDSYLWTWKQDSFIPHLLLSDADQAVSERVLISGASNFPQNKEVLLLYDPLEPEQFDGYSLVIDFAETYSAEKRQQSRDRFKTIRDSGKYDLEFIKLGAFLSKKH